MMLRERVWEEGAIGHWGGPVRRPGGIRWQANWAVIWAARPISGKNTEIHEIFSIFSFF